ncbi:MarR family transcriptional regulator [Thalassospiraceae bacterium LMO-SO8]|nr:MarR family transcriptional regulator [Alphaproteobacteria bacterium LMO-S08]WND76952.1 MarR family transcriptional regulator [Thalassospiraceae bacterium LMO-SO8]
MAADATLHGAGNLGALLVRAFRWFEEGLAADPDTAHLPRLSGTQFMTLTSLDGGGTSIAELARRVGVTRQAMHQQIGEMEKAALVELVDSPTDRRVKLVKLSLLGRTLDRKAAQAIDALERDLSSRIGKDAVAGLRATLSADWGTPGRNGRR